MDDGLSVYIQHLRNNKENGSLFCVINFDCGAFLSQYILVILIRGLIKIKMWIGHTIFKTHAFSNVMKITQNNNFISLLNRGTDMPFVSAGFQTKIRKTIFRF